MSGSEQTIIAVAKTQKRGLILERDNSQVSIRLLLLFAAGEALGK
jgi:hypothetical protein